MIILKSVVFFLFGGHSHFIQPFSEVLHHQLLLNPSLAEYRFFMPFLHTRPDLLILLLANNLMSQHCSYSLSKYSIVKEDMDGNEHTHPIYLTLFSPNPISYNSIQCPFLKSKTEWIMFYASLFQKYIGTVSSTMGSRFDEGPEWKISGPP